MLDFEAKVEYNAYMTDIKRTWAKNLTPEEQFELLLARNERDRAAAREYACRNKVRVAARKYGITEEELQAMIDTANGVCPICTGPIGEKLHIDHCHETGKVRNVLCGNCNNGLGQFKENIETLERAVEYLKLHSQ